MGIKIASTVALRDRADDGQIIENLPILVIHAHSSCNCRCIMCDIWKTKDAKVFGVRDLKPQLDSIRRLGVRWIVFSGGEPLMNPELPELAAILRQEGIRLTLLSTGLLLHKYAAMVAENFDEVIVSLDGPPATHDAIRRVNGAFAMLDKGIRAVRRLRQEIRITARSTIQKANHAYLWETALAARKLGLDGISFLAVDVSSQAFNRALAWPVARQTEISLTIPELAVLGGEISKLICYADKELGPGFIAESPAKLLRIARHFRVQLGLEKPESPVCNAPWVSAVIEADGSVRPCFFHHSIGNLQAATLETIVNGTGGRGFRENLEVDKNPICRNCVCSLNYRP